jgi:hypothetical protein
MQRFALILAAAASVLTGVVNARTIDVRGALASNGGAVDGAVIDFGDVEIRYRAPDPILSAEPSMVGGDFVRTARARAEKARQQPSVYIEIILKSAAKVTNFNFSNKASGSIIADGKRYSFADVGSLALKAPVIVVKSRADRPLALESFDVASVETPVPGAGLLMLAGLAGIGFAMSRRKRI